MIPEQLEETLEFMFKHKFPILIKGAPGTGKTDITTQVSNKLDMELIVSHPVVSDPTDFKGLPFPAKDGKTAEFLPFGDLKKLVDANEDTVFFLDDVGQAPSSVQASLMHLLLARRIGEHKISDKVRFVAATNRRQDRAAVQGILEPVKSRFHTIIELETNLDNWVSWAIRHNMPPELIAFIRFRPNLLHDFNPSANITNTTNPRTIAHVGEMMQKDVPNRYEMFAGAAGDGFASEFTGFLKVYEQLPDMDKLIKDPHSASVPTNPSTIYAICGALSHRVNFKNIKAIMQYISKFPDEFQVLFIREAIEKNKVARESDDKVRLITEAPAFTRWATKNSEVVL